MTGVRDLDSIQKETSEKLREHDLERLKAQGHKPPPPMHFVRATRAEIPVKTPDGRMITTDGTLVLKNDVFIARRIRDGSLVVSESPSPVQQPVQHPVQVSMPQDTAPAQVAETSVNATGTAARKWDEAPE